MRQHPRGEAVGEISVAASMWRIPDARRFEEIPAGRRIREAHVQVGPGSEGVRPGLGHEGGDAAEAPGHVLGHQPEENHPIRHGQCIGVIEVELVLPSPPSWSKE